MLLLLMEQQQEWWSVAEMNDIALSLALPSLPHLHSTSWFYTHKCERFEKEESRPAVRQFRHLIIYKSLFLPRYYYYYIYPRVNKSVAHNFHVMYKSWRFGKKKKLKNKTKTKCRKLGRCDLYPTNLAMHAKMANCYTTIAYIWASYKYHKLYGPSSKVTKSS